MLYMLYTQNIQEMRKLFENDSHDVRKICEVVQLLMTEAFSGAKYFWLTSVCYTHKTDTQQMCVLFCLMSIETHLILLELTNRFLFISDGACFREDINIFARLLNVQVNLSART